jgi:hypothetical protein
MYPDGATKFEGFTLQECGCATGSPCLATCTAECANPATITQTSPCGLCLGAEQAKGVASACIIKAALTDCSADPTCGPFLACAQPCP